MGEFSFPIEALLNEVVTINLDGTDTDVRLVDAEKMLEQPGLSAGFVHFVDPNDGSICLGYGGVDHVYDLVKEQTNEQTTDKGQL